MTLVALTQEPEVKVRLAMIGKWCLPACAMFRDCQCYDDGYTSCALDGTETELKEDPDLRLAYGNQGPEYLRCPACIAAHGGAE